MGKYFCEACKLYDDDVSFLRQFIPKLDCWIIFSFCYRLSSRLLYYCWLTIMFYLVSRHLKSSITATAVEYAGTFLDSSLTYNKIGSL